MNSAGDPLELVGRTAVRLVVCLKIGAIAASKPTPCHWKVSQRMKIILRKDVEKLGEAGTLATVKNGYARNYLIPQGFAIAATPGELKLYEHNQAVKARKIERQERELNHSPIRSRR